MAGWNIRGISAVMGTHQKSTTSIKVLSRSTHRAACRACSQSAEAQRSSRRSNDSKLLTKIAQDQASDVSIEPVQ